MGQTKVESNNSQQLIYKQTTPREMTVLESILVGGTAGFFEVLIDHPLWVAKTLVQSGKKITFNPQVLYRGIMPNAYSMIPITAVQVGSNRYFQNLFFSDNLSLSSSQQFTSAFVAGATSALISCPTEMVMTWQGKNRISFYATAKRIVNQGGITNLYRGLVATAIRDGLFSASYQASLPLMKTTIKTYCENDYAASLLAGMSTGVGATLVSQGVDTIKTIQQIAELKKSFLQASKEIYTSGGWPSFFKGGIARGTRVSSAVTIMGYVSEKMQQALGVTPN